MRACMCIYFEWPVYNMNTVQSLLETPCNWWARTELAVLQQQGYDLSVHTEQCHT